MADRSAVPLDSLVLGYGPMMPLVAAGVGVWMLPGGWAILAVRCSVVWAALILAFIGGVRRGFGFAHPAASPAPQIVAATAYLTLAGLALIVERAIVALALLIAGFALALLLDRNAARRGRAPAHFARLRPPQLFLGGAGLAASWAWLAA